MALCDGEQSVEGRAGRGSEVGQQPLKLDGGATHGGEIAPHQPLLQGIAEGVAGADEGGPLMGRATSLHLPHELHGRRALPTEGVQERELGLAQAEHIDRWSLRQGGTQGPGDARLDQRTDLETPIADKPSAKRSRHVSATALSTLGLGVSGQGELEAVERTLGRPANGLRGEHDSPGTAPQTELVAPAGR